jgi:hypothetical protein
MLPVNDVEHFAIGAIAKEFEAQSGLLVVFGGVVFLRLNGQVVRSVDPFDIAKVQ